MPLFVLGFINGIVESKNGIEPHEYFDTVPDFFTPAYKVHWVLGSFNALTSTIGLTVVGKDKKSIFWKTILFQTGMLGGSMVLYQFSPWTIFGILLYDFAIPVINATIAYRVDQAYLIKSAKYSFQPYYNGEKSEFGFCLKVLF